MQRRTQRLRYGPRRGQHVIVRAASDSRREATIVLIHGGFWKWPYSRRVFALVERHGARVGFDMVNVEYRRLGRFGGGGGWPSTFEDINAAIRLAKQRHPDQGLYVVGHSAGGHLALVAAASNSDIIDGVVAIAAPTDLRALFETGSDVVTDLVRGAPVDSRWKLTSPVDMVPIGVPVVCVHSDTDSTVAPSNSVRFIEAATAAGDDAELAIVTAERHRDAMLSRSRTWTRALAAVCEWSGVSTDDSSGDCDLTKGPS
ncbi:MAG: alpha/beta hydrolase family protein [Ilumatobacter sp.]